MRPPKSPSATSTSSPATSPAVAPAAELIRAAQEYADLFNAYPVEEIDRLIADTCVDPFWDDRTNLLSLLADRPEELGLVLSNDDAHQCYVVVRYRDGEWIVDAAPVDWDALEDRAFAPLDDLDRN